MKYQHPTPFVFLGFYFTSLVDTGKKESISTIKAQLSSNTLLLYLKDKYSDDFDISIFTQRQIVEIESFNSLAITMDEVSKMGISQNGLCLLIGYCFEAAQTDVLKLPELMNELY